jgi:D-serine dehydratase
MNSHSPRQPTFRSLPKEDLTPGQVGTMGWRVSDLLLPALTMRASALQHNAALFQSWCDSHGLSHAPHAKSHLSPELIQLQLSCGAWAMTAATVAQARFLKNLGVERVVIANEVADPVGMTWLAEVSAASPEFRVCTLVDSVELVRHMDDAFARSGASAKVSVLIELGITGGRTGARNFADAIEIADAVATSNYLTLVGVEGFEGVVPLIRTEANLAAVDAFLADLCDLAVQLDRQGAFLEADEIIVSAGGSTYPDRVERAARSISELSRPVRIVVRSSSYLTHEHGLTGTQSPFSIEAANPLGALRSALELWAVVLSRPEKDMAIVGFGKRDASFDIALPSVLGFSRGNGEERALAGAVVERLNDQHAYLTGANALRVGDVVRFGVTHPCTSFDKWRLIPVIDDDDNVVGVVTTEF